VILKVKPVIHSSGKLDLDVSQEVSAAQVNETGVNSTPVILTRRVDTKLTVTDGSTMLLGGLIQENRTSGNAGIPLLKDIPYAGAIFRTSASSVVERTELVILLTPYIMEDNFEATAMTEAFRNQFSWASAVPRPISPLENRPPPPPVNEKPEVGAIGHQHTLPTTDAAKLPEAKAVAPAVERYRSKPYVLPESDGPALTMSTSVVIEQQPSNEAAAESIAQSPAPSSVANSPNAARVESPAGTKPVSDDALRQELIKAIKGGS
jgi:general secretion pathway protein D